MNNPNKKKRHTNLWLGNTNKVQQPHYNSLPIVYGPVVQSNKYPNLNNFIENHKKEINNAKQKYKELVQKGEKRRVLILLACHTNNPIKINHFEKNFDYLKMIPHSDLVVINSEGLQHAHYFKNKLQGQYLHYFIIPNDKLLDFGKWLYALNHVNIEDYEYFCFINDSIIIEHPVTYFFDLCRVKNFDLYGFNNSTQTRFHTQSYLFSIKKRAIQQFIRFIHLSTPNITNNPESVVLNLELKLTDEFRRHKNFINTRKFPDHQGKNLFFNNDFLYLKLKQHGLLPFVKIKRLYK